MNRRLALIVATAAMLSSLGLAPVSSRQWKATPDAIARDYASINDNRPNGEFVLIQWFVPQMVRPGNSGASALISMVRKNVVLMAVHGTLDKTTGTFSFQDIDALEARDRNGRTLNPIARDSLPPTNIGIITGMEASLRQSAGPMGKGMKLFIFDAAGVDSCGQGRLSVSLANETYTWDTPFPGCQSK